MATHFSILAWRTPWTEEPGGLQSVGLQRDGHDWVTERARTRTVPVGVKGVCAMDASGCRRPDVGDSPQAHTGCRGGSYSNGGAESGSDVLPHPRSHVKTSCCGPVTSPTVIMTQRSQEGSHQDRRVEAAAVSKVGEEEEDGTKDSQLDQGVSGWITGVRVSLRSQALATG